MRNKKPDQIKMRTSDSLIRSKWKSGRKITKNRNKNLIGNQNEIKRIIFLFTHKSANTLTVLFTIYMGFLCFVVHFFLLVEHSLIVVVLVLANFWLIWSGWFRKRLLFTIYTKCTQPHFFSYSRFKKKTNIYCQTTLVKFSLMGYVLSWYWYSHFYLNTFKYKNFRSHFINEQI